MKTAFLTGISGLLGTNLAHSLLDEGYNVRGLIRKKSTYKGKNHPNLTLIEGNLFSDLTQSMQQVDVVIHAAAETRQNLMNYSDYARINYNGTILIYLTAVHCNVKKFIYISSANTLGYGSKEEPGNESTPIRVPFDKSFYAKSKLEAENYLIGCNHSTDVIIINPTFMLGAYDSKPSSGKIILMGWKKRIVFYPPGGKNFVHVEDVVQAIMKSIYYGKNKEKIIVAGENLSYNDFFNKLIWLTHQNTLLLKIPKPVLLALGFTGDLLRLIGIKSSLSSNNMKILCIENFYSNKKSVSYLDMKYRTIDSAILDAMSYFSNANNQF